MSMYDDVKSVLITEEELKECVKRLGAQITEDYKDKNLLLVSVLRGSVIFMADLMREIKIPCTIDFMAVSSYGSGTQSSGIVKIEKDLDVNLEGYDIRPRSIIDALKENRLPVHIINKK